MSRRTVSLSCLAVLAAVVLAGCTPPAPAPSPAPSASDAPSPSAPVTRPPALANLPGDAVLGVSAVATGPDGAALQLAAIVHRSVAWDSPEGAPLAAMMTAGCAGALDESVYAADLWSFALIDVSAIELGDGWAPGAEIALHPTGEFLALASDGALAEIAATPETPHCDRSRVLTGAGSGRLVVGFRGDTDAVGAAGQFTRWANHRYGFGAASGVMLSSCAAVVTELGASLGGGADTWSTADTATECTTGTGLPEDTDS